MHEFYVREVSGDPYRWHLPEFFCELFNYCFPVDYRIKLRQKLHTSYQNDKSVKDKVHKVWFGLRKKIQQDLWKERLNPEVSSLKRIVVMAEIIVIAQLQLPLQKEKAIIEDDASGLESNPMAEINIWIKFKHPRSRMTWEE